MAQAEYNCTLYTGKGKGEWKTAERSGSWRILVRPQYWQTRVFQPQLILYTTDTPCPWGILEPYWSLHLKFADDHLARCCAHHDCFSSTPRLPPLPTRVIDVGRNCNTIRLIESSNFGGHYICLSHCWGSIRPLVTTGDNYKDHLQHIPWETIPHLYQDAIRLAWRYDIQYVWIDSICIVQDDLKDWEHEAGRMSEVYGNSFLTIAAISNDDCSSGILDSPTGSTASFSHFLTRSGTTKQGKPFRWVVHPEHFDQLSCDACKHRRGKCLEPLTTRAWALQEWLLSPRVLSFGAQRLSWTCRHSDDSTQTEKSQRFAHKTWLNSGQKLPFALRANAQDAYKEDFFSYGERWIGLIRDYSRLKITKEHDRLPALSGLAKAYQRARPGIRYLAGLWESWLHRGLLWFVTSQSHFEPSITTETFRTTSTLWMHPSQSPWGAPSWSWAFTGQPVNFEHLHEYRILHTEILRAECTLSNPEEPMGNVEGGILDVRGPLIDLHQIYPGIIREDGKGLKQTTISYDQKSLEQDLTQTLKKSNHCLLVLVTDKDRFGIWTTFGLILELMDSGVNAFRRVGLLRSRHVYFERFHNVGRGSQMFLHGDCKRAIIK